MWYEVLRHGLNAPICLTWEITYACNLRCVHCLSSSGRRAPDELTTEEAKQLIDEWAAMQVFYINVGGGEPMTRPDFFELMEYAIARRIGIKFSTNGTLIDEAAADWIASADYLDVQISLDGATADVNDPIRGAGSYARARRALRRRARGDRRSDRPPNTPRAVRDAAAHARPRLLLRGGAEPLPGHQPLGLARRNRPDRLRRARNPPRLRWSHDQRSD